MQIRPRVALQERRGHLHIVCEARPTGCKAQKRLKRSMPNAGVGTLRKTTRSCCAELCYMAHAVCAPLRCAQPPQSITLHAPPRQGSLCLTPLPTLSVPCCPKASRRRQAAVTITTSVGRRGRIWQSHRGHIASGQERRVKGVAGPICHDDTAPSRLRVGLASC